MGRHPQDKHATAGYGHIGLVLWAEAGEGSYAEFIRRLVFSIAIGNGDMHLKNWSLLYRNPQKPVLSPAYDFVPTIAYIENDALALNLGGTKDFAKVTMEKFMKMAVRSKASEKLTAKIVNEFVERFDVTWREHRNQLLLPDEVRLSIEKHLFSLPLFEK